METDTITYVKDFILTFTSILYEALPFIILGAVIAGILEEFLPQKLITRILPRSHTYAVALGGLLGIVFPMCECGIIPIMRRLLRKGLPLSCCIAYLLAGPIINGIVILSTYVAFSNFTPTGGITTRQLAAPYMVAFRVGFAYLIAVTTAMIVDRLHRKHGDDLLRPMARPGKLAAEVDEHKGPKPSVFTRLSRISETSLHDFIDITVFLCLGALLAATIRLWLTHDRIELLSANHPVLAIVLMMGVAVILCLCSEADAFVAASFTKLVPAAKLSFLVLGPMLDIKLYLMYTRVFRPRLIRTIMISVVIQVFLYCLLLHLILEYGPPSWTDWMLIKGGPSTSTPLPSPTGGP